MMEKYGTFNVYQLKKDHGTKIFIPLHEEELIAQFEKDAEWEKTDEEEEVCAQVQS